MTPDAARWDQIRRCFAAALDLSERERAPFLARACGTDESLRSEVVALLAAHDASGPVDRLAAELAGAIAQVQTHAAPQPGALVAHYTILDLLGAGGMGVVYRARDEQLHRLTALKFLPPHRVADAALKRRFLTEARAIGALDHPNVCAIYEIGETPDGQLYIAMPLYEGETLQAVLARGPLPARRAVAIAGEIARGLSAAHSRGIIHRDVKPSNVMILPDGHVKVLDFGVAKVKGLTGTASDARMGTLSYMSPEQIAGEVLDQRSDVWALGAVLYEMLTGRVPGARSYMPPSALRDDLPVRLDDVVATAIAVLPERRFPSMAGFAAALDAITFDDARGTLRTAPPDQRTATAAPIRPSAERRRAAVLVSRVSHLDALVEHLDPSALDDVYAAVRDAALDAVRQNGGILNQADGDEIVALFGIPAGQEDDDLRAVKAALSLHASVRAIAPAGSDGQSWRIAVQTGIDSGSLVAQRLRDESRRYSVTGPAAHAAARLAAAAAPDTILISPGCHRLVEPFLVVGFARPVALQPEAEPIVPLHVLGESGIQTRLEAADRSALTPFAGRAPQLSLLERLAAESRDGRGRIAVVVGDAGIGKSRIVHELRERVTASATAVLTGRCRAYGGISAYLPVVEVLREILAVRAEDDAARVVVKVRETEASLEPFIPFYLHLLSVPSDVFIVPQHLRGEHFHAAMLDAIAALLMAAAQRSPLLLLLEDWHWADDASREVLHRIAEGVESHRVAVVVTTRPEPAALAELATIGTVVHLEPLETSACLVLLRSLLGAARIGEDLARRLQERTGGNPFFLEQVAYSLREEGAVVIAGDEAVLTRDLDSLQVPATVQAVIRARLDRLDGDAREVLRIAAAIGREFGAELLSAAVPGHIDTPRALERLRGASLIQQVRVLPDPAFRFKHILTLEVAYDSLLGHQRKTAHGAIGRALERQGGRGDERAEALAHHFGKADLWPEAVRYGRRAVARLRALSQFANALALLDRLQSWLPHLPEEQSRQLLPDILLEQERMCETLGQRRRQQTIITELIAILAPRGASSRLAEAYLRQGDLLTLLKQFDAAERALNTALRLARDLEDRRLERSGLRSIGLLRWHQDRHLDALAIAEQALAFDRNIGDERSIIGDLANIGSILRALGEHDRARAVLEEALAMPIVEREPAGMSSVLHNLANVHRACGDVDTALACLLRADDAMQANMLPVHRSFHLTTIAHIRLQRGDVEEAVRTYQQAVDLSRRARHAEGLAQALRLLGDVQFALGRDAAAAANLTEAALLFAQLEDQASQAESCARVGVARERLAEWTAALAAWNQALELRRSLADPAGELEAREGVARATRRIDPAACIAAFEQALALATVLGAGSRQVALHNTLGIVHWERGDFAEAFRHYDAGLRLCRLIGDRVHEGLMLNCVGLALTRLQRYDEARTVLEESVTLNRQTSERRLEAHALAALAEIAQRRDGAGGARPLLEQALALRRLLGDDEGVADLHRRLIDLESAAR